MSLLNILKHLPGKHPQSRHAWRYGSAAAIRRSLTANRNSESHPNWETGEYKARARARDIAGKSPDELKTLLRKTGRYAHRQMLADEWIKATKRPAESYPIHGMREKEDPSAAIKYRGINIYFPDDAKMRKNVATSLANWESLPLRHIPEDRPDPYLPDKLFQTTANIVFTRQANKNDSYWAQKFDIPGFVSSGTGGDGNIVVYNGKPAGNRLIAHEMGHNLAAELYESTTPPVGSQFGKRTADWRAGKPGAEEPVREYGKNNGAEDFATSVEAYYEDPIFMKKNFPLRYEAIRRIMED